MNTELTFRVPIQNQFYCGQLYSVFCDRKYEQFYGFWRIFEYLSESFTNWIASTI